ncbi:glycosyltransferase family 9 protein [Brevibacterium yomogidense]|uniref:glycosyltransferase family 9 protein n=1 Tax=Brevibacterium yomogidense TaxID=946573 RepID=UPI0018DF8389|nr:glycosyltransferase family 9 protein [Brevibacterium yomogidense]
MSRPIVLALRALKLGDLLVAVPALRGLRAGFPDHRLVLACAPWLRPVVDLVGGVDDLLPTSGLDAPLGVPPGVVDVAVNLHGNGAESRGRLEALRAPRQIGHAAPDWEGPAWIDDIHERDRWVRVLHACELPGDAADLRLALPVGSRGAGEPDSAVVHVGAAHASRHWPVERFAEVTRALLGAGRRVMLTGSGAERERADQVAALVGPACGLHTVAGAQSLEGFLATIAAARIVVSADTGAAHLASAFGVPSVVLFGPAPPAQWGPPPGPHRVLTDPTVRRGDVFARTPDPALLGVRADDVIRAVHALLQ